MRAWRVTFIEVISMNLKTVLAFVCFCLPFSGHSAALPQDPEQALLRVAQGALLIDVRTPEEYHQGHLEKVINIPYDAIVQGARLYRLKPEMPLVLYCRSGRRSGIAQQTLQQAGFTQVYNGGGYDALKAAIANSP